MRKKQSDYKKILDFYNGKKVFITGNTGFKGTWLTYILLSVGAEVTGYSLKPSTEPALFNIIGLADDHSLRQYYADVRDISTLKEAFQETRPEIVFHLAAQPIVRDSYKDPVTTYETNVMGTVNICEAVRFSALPIAEGGMSGNEYAGVRSFLNVTTDKVYRNNEWEWGYRETDFLDGFDPYSNSKSCSELVTHSYKNSFFNGMIDETGKVAVRVSTARAGNVIGGGDFSNNRIIPDCVRSISATLASSDNSSVIYVRNPYSVRPYEHVLEPLFTYLMIAKAQYEDTSYAGCYNVGPEDLDCINTGALVSLFCNTWNASAKNFNKHLDFGRSDDEKYSYSFQMPSVTWENKNEVNAPHEANFLKLDCSKLKSIFGWKTTWHITDAIEQTVAWTKVWLSTGKEVDLGTISKKDQMAEIKREMDKEIALFIEDSDDDHDI